MSEQPSPEQLEKMASCIKCMIDGYMAKAKKIAEEIQKAEEEQKFPPIVTKASY